MITLDPATWRQQVADMVPDPTDLPEPPAPVTPRSYAWACVPCDVRWFAPADVRCFVCDAEGTAR